MPFNLFDNTRKMKPVPVYDPQKAVDGNVASGGTVVPSGGTIRPFTGSGDSVTDGIDYLKSLYTSPAKEESLRRASIANRKILAVTDALRHIGNIYNTARGASPQTFNSPVVEEEARYERGKALRDAANAKYYSYQHAKAAQDAAQRKWEQQMAYNQAKDAATLQATQAYRAATLAEQQRYHDMMNTLYTRKADDAKEYNTNRLGIMQQNANTSAQRAANAGSGGGRGRQGSVGGYTTTRKKMVRNPITGKMEEVTETTTRVPHNGQQQPSGGSSNAYGGTKHGSGGSKKENKWGVKPSK